MLAKIDNSKNKVHVKITEKVTVGKVYEACLSTVLLKDDNDIVIEADLIVEKDVEIALLQSKLSWYESNVKTLSALEWSEYNSIGSS
ncbi:MAG: hypothetical protein GY861_14020 [bacterium]|nr:hypothetical protein [bacterium]